jgi:hypothetical protein
MSPAWSATTWSTPRSSTDESQAAVTKFLSRFMPPVRARGLVLAFHLALTAMVFVFLGVLVLGR